jgi:hypothetical protein
VEQVKVSTYGYVLIAANQHGFSQPSEVVSAAAAHCIAPCWPALCTLYHPVLSCHVMSSEVVSTALPSDPYFP